jgi:hypothetical protein
MTDDTTQMAHRTRALSYALSLLSGRGGEREGRDATGAVTYADGSASDGDRTDWSTQR